MKKALNTILAALLIFLVAGLTGYFYLSKNDFFSDEIFASLAQETGYKIVKPEPFRLRLFPNPVLTAINIKLVNPSIAVNSTVADIDSLSFELQWSSLLRFEPVIDVLAHSADFRFSIDASGEHNWVVSPAGSSTPERPVDIDQFKVEKARVSFNNMKTGEDFTLDLERLEAKLSEGQASVGINSSGTLAGTRFLAFGDVVYKAENKLLGVSLQVASGEAGVANKRVEAESVSAWIKEHAVAFPVHGSIFGTVSLLDREPRGELNFKLKADSLDDFSYWIEQLKFTHAGIGPVNASGVVVLNGSDLDIENFHAALKDDRVAIEANGFLHNLLSEVRLNINTTMQAQSLQPLLNDDRLDGIVRDLLDKLNSIEVSGSVMNHEKGYKISDLDLGFAHKSFRGRTRGNLVLSDDSVHFDLEPQITASNPLDLFELLGFDDPRLNEIGSIDVSARMSGSPKSYRIESATGKFQDEQIKISLSGRLDLAAEGVDIDIDSQVQVDDFSRLVGVLPEPLHAIVPGLRGRATMTIRGSSNDYAIRNLQTEFTRKGRKLSLNGEVSRLPYNPRSDLDFRLFVNESIELEQYFPKLADFQLTGPFTLHGAVRQDGARFVFSEVIFKGNEVDLGGSIDVNLGETPVRIALDMKSTQFIAGLVERDSLTIDDETPDKAEATEGMMTEAVTSEEQQEKIFQAVLADTRIETGWVNDIDLQFSYLADKARIGEYDMENLSIKIAVHDGVFNLQDYSLSLAGKPITFQGSINTGSDPPTYLFTAHLEGDSLKTLLNTESDLFVGGELSGYFELASRGDTLGAVLENLNGQGLISMGQLVINSAALNIVSSSIFRSMLKGVTRKKPDTKGSAYQCGILGFVIDEGVIGFNRTFAMQAKEYNLAGKGKIDLNTGLVDIVVFPKARKGLGISISSLIGGFKIKGHFATPDYGVTGGLMSTMVSGYLLAPTAASAGLVASSSVVAPIIVTGIAVKGIIDRLTARNYTCTNTLKRIERARSRR